MPQKFTKILKVQNSQTMSEDQLNMDIVQDEMQFNVYFYMNF